MAAQELGPLNWQIPIVNKDGTPTYEFMRKWEAQISNNASIPGTAANISALLDKLGNTRGAILERGASLWAVVVPGTANRVLVDNGTGNDPSYVGLSALLDAVFGNTRGSILYRGASGWAKLSPNTAGFVLTDGGPGADPAWAAGGGGGATGANPTATAGDVAVNGVATTFMRSDAAPAVQKASASQFGIAKVDGTTITA